MAQGIKEMSGRQAQQWFQRYLFPLTRWWVTAQATRVSLPANENSRMKLVRNFSISAIVLAGLLAGVAQAQTTVKYIHTDALGSVVAITDENRNVIERREYEPYGLQLTPAVEDGPGYTGHVQDAATGLVYMQQRYYDPAIGAMLSVDPVTAYQQPVTNFCRYCYARNNPYKFTDPDGRVAVITQMKDGSISIDIPVNFSGAGATPSNINAIKADISARWSGAYNVNGTSTQVKVQVVNVDANTPAKAVNNIQLTTGKTSNTAAQGASFVRNGNSGEWNTNSSGMQVGEAAHEGGHLMGAKDHYTSSLDANGNRVTSAAAGFSGNLMGELKQGVTTNDANMKEIMSDKRNIHEVQK